MNLKIPRWVDKAVGVGLLVFLCIYNVLILRANLDLTDGRHVLFMDEQISYDGVQNILHPESIFDLLDNVFIGDIYGRIFWNLAAVVSWLPEKVLGPPGQIVATRFLQHVLLLAAYVLLALTFLKKDNHRLLFILLLLMLPGTAYYAHMPKPEPAQVFFLAAFLFFFVRHHHRFGWYYIFLGLSFGTKISFLPLVPVFVGLSGLASYNPHPSVTVRQFGFLTLEIRLRHRWDQVIVGGIKAAVFFLMGLVIANPFLIFSFVSSGYMKSYLGSTFFNTAHGRDDSSVTFLDWLKILFGDLLGPPSIFLVLVLAIVLVNLTIQLYRPRYGSPPSGFNNELITQVHRFFLDFRVLTLIIALLLLLPMMLLVKRTWDFYLHPGLVFGVLLTMITIEKGVNANSKIARWGALVLLGAVLISSPFSFIKNSQRLDALAHRTQSTEHVLKLKQYQYLHTFLTGLSERASRKISVIYDPYLYLLDSNDNYEIMKFYGDYHLSWEDQRDVIIFYKRVLDTNLSPTNIEYSDYTVFKDLYQKYVVDPSTEFYYALHQSEFADLIILVRNDLLSYLKKE